ncbi:hypothetical protein J5N97_011081 [Dioscorea zingiberensis]|uniref:Uncharacterized protein n=1 Tax=Dioscorea zingiberensis TaxID=325984 RepID=A0A9D5D0C8_9LILI|nr:hypothetical protein J5N97_011081 [Dioscorea zingiberensis]
MELENKENDHVLDLKQPQVIKHRGWKAMPYVIGNETFEKLGTIGTSSNLLVYLTTIYHLKSVTAATMLNVFNGTTNLAPVIGAFISDTYLGRYVTLGAATMASLTGMVILTLTSGIKKLHPPECSQGQVCKGPEPFQLAVLFAGFAFMVIGAGGIRPCNLAFGADQFDPKTESGKRGINSFFNWYYFTFTISVMLSSTVIIYIQSEISWTLGLAIPAVLMFTSCLFFFMGSRIYVKVRPEGSPFTSIAQVFISSFRKRRLEHPQDPKNSLFNPPHFSLLISKLPYTHQFRFLDKASIISSGDEIKPDGTAANPWRLCTIQQVEEVKCLARIIPVWSTGIIYYIAVVQQTTYVVFQAQQSNRHLGNSSFQIPAASFTVFTMFALTMWIPIYDRVIVPMFRKIPGKEDGITLLQRMGVGLVLGIAAMFVSGLVEERRRNYALNHPVLTKTPNGYDISSMSGFWLIPQLVLIGLSEAFNAIGQIEFYYKQFPEHMRSVAGSLFFCSMALSNYLSGLIVAVVHRITGKHGGDNWLSGDLNKGKLDYYYFLIALLGVFNFMYFLVCAKWYRYKGLENDQGEVQLKEEKQQGPPV